MESVAPKENLRRRRLSAPERRLHLIDVASRLFAFKGLHGVTTKEIAEAAGVSEPVLYQHFKSKEQIYEALESLCDKQKVHVHKACIHTPPGIDGLILVTYILTASIPMCMEPGSRFGTKSVESDILLRLMGYSFLEDGRFSRTMIKACLGGVYDYWQESYCEAMASGHIASALTDEAPVWLSYQFMVGAGLFSRPAEPLGIGFEQSSEQTMRSLVIFILRGMGVKDDVIKSQIDWDALRLAFESIGRKGPPETTGAESKQIRPEQLSYRRKSRSQPKTQA